MNLNNIFRAKYTPPFRADSITFGVFFLAVFFRIHSMSVLSISMYSLLVNVTRFYLPIFLNTT